MSNEEKEPVWFVWENTTRGGIASVRTPAKYRTVPMSGMGQKADDHRFVFKKQLEPSEENLSINELVQKYPCPV